MIFVTGILANPVGLALKLSSPQYKTLVSNARLFYSPHVAGWLPWKAYLKSPFILFYESQPAACFKQSAAYFLPLAKASYLSLYLPPL